SVQHDADGHGDLLQGDAHRGAAIDDAALERVRHRAGDHREDLQARLPRLRGTDYLRRPGLRAGQEDHVARRLQRAVGAREVPVRGMKIALLQIDPTVGDLAGNARLILDALADAHTRGATLAVTPELALVGYLPRDLLLSPAFVRRSWD